MTQHDVPPPNAKALAEQIVNTERQAAACQQGAYNRLVEELNQVNKLGKGLSDNVFKIVAETDRHDGKPSMVGKSKESGLVISDPFKKEEARHEAAVNIWLEGHDAKVDAQNWNRDMHNTTQLREDFQKAYYTNGEAGVRKFAEEINSQNTTAVKFNVNTENGATKVIIAGRGVAPSEFFEFSPESEWRIPTLQNAGETATMGGAEPLKPISKSTMKAAAQSVAGFGPPNVNPTPPSKTN